MNFLDTTIYVAFDSCNISDQHTWMKPMFCDDSHLSLLVLLPSISKCRMKVAILFQRQSKMFSKIWKTEEFVTVV